MIPHTCDVNFTLSSISPQAAYWHYKGVVGTRCIATGIVVNHGRSTQALGIKFLYIWHNIFNNYQ